MNFRTTVILLVLVVAVGVTIYVLHETAPPPKPTVDMFPAPTPAATQKLIDEKFGEAKEIVVQVPEQPKWRFVRAEKKENEPSAGWQIVEPFEGQAQRWQVDRIGRRLTDATYTVKYKPDESGMTAAQAGLEPPRATVTLTNEEGKSVTVQIGRNEGQGETLVSVGESPEIYQVKPSLKDLLRNKALDYLDLQLFDVKPTDIVRMQITSQPENGEAATYELVKDAGQWQFDQPSQAKAIGDKIRDLCSAFSTLRAASWETQDAKDLEVFGLQPAALTVTVTAEETPKEVPKMTEEGDKGDQKKEETPAPVMRELTVHFSATHPLGDDGKVYVRRDDDQLVGTVLNTIADKFQPNLKEWRNNAIVEKDPTTAREVEVTTDGQSVTLERSGLDWNFADGRPADRKSVDLLLQTIKSVEAVGFDSGVESNPAKFGLDNPQGTIVLTYDDGTKVPIAIGGYTDSVTKRLVYARTDEQDTVAKIRVEEVKKLLLKPSDFRDRTVVNVPADRLQQLKIRRPGPPGVGEEGTQQKLTLVNENDAWHLTEPVMALADEKQVDKLTKSLSDLVAQKAIDAGGDLSQYGLDHPDVELTYTFLPPTAYRIEPAEATTQPATQPSSQPVKMVPKPYQPPAESYTLDMARKDGKTYVIKSEQPNIVYVLGSGVYDDVTAEFRDTDLFTFEAPKVTGFTLVEDGVEHGFKKTDKGWEYSREPDLPIDAKKVTNYLLQVDNLAATRYVVNEGADLAHYGLDAPQYSLTVEVKDKTLPGLLVSSQEAPGGGRYAMLEGSSAVFVLPADAINRIQIKIAEFEEPE